MCQDCLTKEPQFSLLEKKELLLTDEELEEGSPSFNYAVAKATVDEPEKNFVKIGNKNIRKTMDMQTARKLVKDFESQQDEAVQDFNFKAKITDKGNRFEIGGDEFVRESVKPNHRYSYIVEKTINLQEQQNLVHYTGFPGWSRGTWGKDWANHGPFSNDEGLDQPIMVHKDIVRNINGLKSIASQTDFALVFSKPHPSSGRRASENFKNGKGLVFIYEGVSFKEDAARFTAALISQGFTKVKWAPNWVSKPAVLAEFTSRGQMHLVTTDSSSFRNGPAWNLHKRRFKIGSGSGTEKYRLFYYYDVRNPGNGSAGYYGVENNPVPAKAMGSLGAYSKKLPASQMKYEIYGDDYTDSPYDTNRFIPSLISGEILGSRKLKNREMTVGEIYLKFGTREPEKPKTIIAPTLSRDELRSSRDDDETTPVTLKPFDDTAQPPAQQPTNTSNVSTNNSDSREKDKLIIEILKLSQQNNIDIKTLATRDLSEYTLQDLQGIRQDLDKLISDRQSATTGLVSTVIGTFLTTQWNNLKGMFGARVSQASEDALQAALTLLQDAMNPNSALGKQIYTKQNITIAAMLAAGGAGFFLIRRFLRDRKQRELAKHMYGDFGARRELQNINRRSGLDKVPQRELMTMLSQLERYELSSPQVRRLYDL